MTKRKDHTQTNKKSYTDPTKETPVLESRCLVPGP
jgi:hypothetical protein